MNGDRVCVQVDHDVFVEWLDVIEVDDVDARLIVHLQTEDRHVLTVVEVAEVVMSQVIQLDFTSSDVDRLAWQLCFCDLGELV